jgi:twitching motility protein PilT
MHIHDLLTHSVKERASDLHINAGQSPALRIDGVVRSLSAPPLTNEQAHRLVYSIMNERQKSLFEDNMELDFSFALPGLCRFRVNVFQQLHGIGAVFRAIPDEVQTIEQLGLPLVLRDIAKLRRGLVLLTGPTGHGKTTTLAAIIHEINQTRFEHIITIEDPIEYQHRPAKCVITQRELGTHTQSFANALRSSLREDPDVILLGEMRDLETISLALTAAETGHLVLATLHTRSAADTINRVIDVFPKEQQHQVRAMASNSLEAVVCQQLVPRKSRGRVCATEVMMVNFAVRNLIREGKVFQIPTLMQTQTTAGMVTMEQSLLHLFRNGIISRETLLERCYDPSVLEKMEEVTQTTPRSRSRSGR